MKATGTKFKTVSEYIAAAPSPAKSMLKELRKTIQEAAPEAEEMISYNMPAYKLHGVLVYYGGYKNHIGLYPASAGTIQELFKKELADYKQSKGTIQFPVERPLPLTLISKIVKLRVRQNKEKAKLKGKK